MKLLKVKLPNPEVQKEEERETKRLLVSACHTRVLALYFDRSGPEHNLGWIQNPLPTHHKHFAAVKR